MEGQGRNIATIYGSSAGMTESRDGLADNKTGNAIRGSTRSIPVVREQYCLCTPTTRLEKRLVITVLTLVVVIILLLVLIIVLATRDEEVKKLARSFISIDT